jgi:putative glutamine amidotransferase
MKPVIGLTMYTGQGSDYYSIRNYYTNSVFASGGIPVGIPVVDNEEDYDSYIDMLDGIIFTGGIDISPLSYGENPLNSVNIISIKRDEYELGLFRVAYDRKIPILGICRGNQLINVALGGTLYQDISTQLPNSQGHSPEGICEDELYHSINIKKESKLYDIFDKEKIHVNSFHHQSIKKLGNDLRISAFSDDGIIEGVEGTGRGFLVGVQWHPECLTKRYPMFLKLFNALVSAAE